MDRQELEKEIFGSLAGYVITVAILLVMIYILGLIQSRSFYPLLAGFLGGVGITAHLWSRSRERWRREMEELEARLADRAAPAGAGPGRGQTIISR